MVDRWDVLVTVGALLIGGGLWFIWPPAILLWLGVVAMATGLAGARNGHSQ